MSHVLLAPALVTSAVLEVARAVIVGGGASARRVVEVGPGLSAEVAFQHAPGTTAFRDRGIRYRLAIGVDRFVAKAKEPVIATLAAWSYATDALFDGERPLLDARWRPSVAIDGADERGLFERRRSTVLIVDLRRVE